ncbi:hypothetical protein SEVIR_9G249200v4 [Setaria viridis]|uniref:FLZ-type domain-containing protein n=1 Tax=Setaria viridis TaxID=4556 RepID=A0A4U6TAD1_SETVI|nr:FCS-Like Zinc finger 8-like [Setaria viridis]TKV94026.1 hypothetical protein SEVIR_9G249200v2 [Setaria viridis]
MLGRMAGGVADAEQRDASSDRGRHAGTAVPPSPLSAPPKLFLADDSGVCRVSPVPVEAAAVMSPTSTLQAAVDSPTSPAAKVGAFSSHGASSSSGGDRRCKSRSRRCHRRPAWEAARNAGLGLAGALNGDDAVPHAATVLRGQSLRSPAFAVDGHLVRSSSPQGRRCLMMSPTEMEASEDYTRVIARGGPNPRTTHIFDDRVVVDGSGGFSIGAGGEDDESFLRWCHGCSKDLGQGKDIFMYRGEMAFCSHECRYREMLLFDEES